MPPFFTAAARTYFHALNILIYQQFFRFLLFFIANTNKIKGFKHFYYLSFQGAKSKQSKYFLFDAIEYYS